ncbi:MFS transporter [Shimia sagamensis]|uniref:Predicted arabinose efflux permease, MFS family n=1 Tax=Shimia sagamensis TaxID=1566352 RepID=A0ABY1NLU9_9RHOB|nr:MFS transporter [Shimia sagamensis]SMP11007.1 Predicted arabinose efflux permease, MFS family [Shimia sagamensis]
MSKQQSMLPVVVIWLAGVGAAGQFAKISVTFDHVGNAYPEAGARLGFALSILGLAGIFLGVVAGVLATKIGMRRTLIGGLGLSAAVSFVQALGLSFDAFLLSRVIEGLAHLAIVVAAPTLIAKVSPPEKRAFSLTLWGTFFGVAFALFAWVGRPLVEVFGLNAMYFAHGVWMAASVLGVATIGLPDERAFEVTDALLTLGGVLKQHWVVYRSPFMNAAAVGWLFYTFCFVSLLTLLPPFIAPEWRTFTVGAMPLMSMISSMTLGVWLLRFWRTVHVIQTGFLISAGAALALILVPGSPFACLVLAGALGLIQGASFALVPELNDTAADRANANGVFAQAGNFGNTIGTPILLAVVAVSGYGGLMLVSAILLLIGAALHLVLERARARA